MIYWDTETGLIQPAVLAPDLACITWLEDAMESADIVHGRDPRAKKVAEAILTNEHMAANTAFDLAVLAVKWKEFFPLVFEALDADKSHDVILFEKLFDIGDGCYRMQEEAGPDGLPIYKSVKYGLSDLHERYCGAPLEKDKYRLTYGKLRHVALANWEEGAVLYPKKDTEVLRNIWALQRAKQRRVEWSQYLVNAPAQSRAAFAYHLVSCWGIQTDCQEVRRFLRQIEAEQDIRRDKLIDAQLVRPDGSRNKKAATSLMKEVMGPYCQLTKKGVDLYREWWRQVKTARMAITPEMKLEVKQKLFDAGYISLSGDACLASGNKTLIEYAQYGTHQTLHSKVAALDTGGLPVQTSFETLLATGRASSFASKILPNSAALLNLPRKPGMRECFVPRNWQMDLPVEHRRLFLAADYGMAELVSLAQVCFTMFGWSNLRLVLNAGRDPHLELAAMFAGIPYEDALGLYKNGDPRIEELRTMGKVYSFGKPGGISDETFVEFAAKVYKVSFGDTFEEAFAKVQSYSKLYFERYPEVALYHKRIKEMCNLDPRGLTSVRSFKSDRLRGFIPFTVTANHFFQSLTADAFKCAFYEAQRRCYLGERISYGRYRETWLTGSRVVAPVHDELVVDVPELTGHEAAEELVKLMVEEYQKWTPDVYIGVEAALMRRWRKKAKPVRNSLGRLIPFEDRQLQAA